MLRATPGDYSLASNVPKAALSTLCYTRVLPGRTSGFRAGSAGRRADFEAFPTFGHFQPEALLRNIRTALPVLGIVVTAIGAGWACSFSLGLLLSCGFQACSCRVFCCCFWSRLSGGTSVLLSVPRLGSMPRCPKTLILRVGPLPPPPRPCPGTRGRGDGARLLN